MDDDNIKLGDNNLKVASRLVRIASISVGDGNDTVWCVRHYNGSGASAKFIEVHVIRGQKFLGRFEIQEQPTFDVAWQPASEGPKATEAELIVFRKARMLLLGAGDKLWPEN